MSDTRARTALPFRVASHDIESGVKLWFGISGPEPAAARGAEDGDAEGSIQVTATEKA